MAYLMDLIPTGANMDFTNYSFGLRGLSGALLVVVVTIIFIVSLFANLKENPFGDGKLRPDKDPSLPKPSEIVSLHIYPIKSCRGVKVQRSMLKTSGLDLDRNWMFVDAADNKFLTIRALSEMTLIDTALNASQTQLKISIHGTEDSVTISARPTREWLESNTKLTKVYIWEEWFDGWEYDADINAIFSKYFKKAVKLVYKGPTTRPCGTNATEELYGESVGTNFADVMSLTVASDSSVNDLNRRLAERGQDELTIERFRPNIVIKGNTPWEEDSWKRVQIVTMFHELEQLRRIDLDVVARCARCQVPNVNPDTAEKHTKEPWDTLMKFRRVDKGGVAKYKPCFGMLCVPKKEGEIRVGSMLDVLELTDKHSYCETKFVDL